MSDNNPQQGNASQIPSVNIVDVGDMERRMAELQKQTDASTNEKSKRKPRRRKRSKEISAKAKKTRLKKQKREKRAARWSAFKSRLPRPEISAIAGVLLVVAVFAVWGANVAASIPTREPPTVAAAAVIKGDQLRFVPTAPRDDPPVVNVIKTESIPRPKMFDDAFDALPSQPAGDIPAQDPKQKGKQKKNQKQSMTDDSQIMQLASLVPVDREAPRENASPSGDEPQFELPPVPRSDGEPDPYTALASAREYLVETATPGGTMARQGPQLAIERLHPEFVLRLAPAIKEARIRGLPCAGVFSAYRPPAFGVGGFADKSASLHAYGLAVDMKCVGRPGSSEARHWHSIARRHGVICPYGPNNRAEWNHCQPTNLRVVTSGNPLRKTITPQGPIDLERMWNAARSVIVNASAAETHEPQSTSRRVRRRTVEPVVDPPLFQSAS